MHKIKNIVFDADGTLLRGENPYLILAKKLECEDTVKGWVHEYLDGTLDYQDMVEKEIKLFVSKHIQIYGDHPRTGDFERLMVPPQLRENVGGIIKTIKAQGIRIFVLSSGFRFVIRELARVQITDDHVYANRILYDVNGKFATIQVEVRGEKIAAFDRLVNENSLNPEETAYVGDNAFDDIVINHILSKGGTVFFLEDSNSEFGLKEKPLSDRFIAIDDVSSLASKVSSVDAHETTKEIFKYLDKYSVVVICGLPGTGKSVIAREIVRFHNFRRISSNKIRLKELYPDQTKYGGIYGKDNHFENRKNVYKLMRERAVNLLKSGDRVLLDGTHMDELRDETVQSLLTIVSPKEILLLVVKTNEDLVTQRSHDQNKKDIDKLISLYEHWKKDIAVGKFWYPRKNDYPDIDILEVVNGEVGEVK